MTIISLYRSSRWRFFRWFFLLWLIFTHGAALAASDATVIMYHRFGEDTVPSTNIKLETFDAHLATIEAEGWIVLPLDEISRKVIAGEILPDKALAITVDDAFLSVYEEAFPRLQAYGYPFTLFVSTQVVDQNLAGYATWDQIKEMKAAGVEIGHHSHSHPHMHLLNANEMLTEIAISNARFVTELGETPRYFAYPFGEFSPLVRDVIKDAGFIAAFGQHSGVVHASIDRHEWPRFAFNEAYSALSRLTTAVEAVALPVRDFSPDSMVVEDPSPKPSFTVDTTAGALDHLSCFATNQGEVDVFISDRRVEVHFPQPLHLGRSRLNCTMPAVEDGRSTGRWYWFGRQFVRD